MGVKLTQSERNLANSIAASNRRRTGEAAPPPHYPQRQLPVVTLREISNGEWVVVYPNGSELPATDIEAYLWLELLKKGGPDSPTDTPKKRGEKGKVAKNAHLSSGGGE